MKNSFLLTPGPVPVPDFVKQAISQPVIHHRTPQFEAFYLELLNNLQYLFQTKAHVCTMMGSGTYGVETAMYSLFKADEEVLVVNMGKFSERWADYGELLGLEVIQLKKNWGKSVNSEEILNVLNKCKAPKGLVLTHSETSTGVCLDLEEIAIGVRQKYPDILILVDAITSVGTIPFYFDEWNIDCAVVAAQKALLNPAGTVCFAISERGKQNLNDTHAADSRNLYNFLYWAERKNYPYTPPVSLLYGLKAATDFIISQSLPKIWNKTHQAAKYFRHAIAKIGGEIFADSPSDSLTAFTLAGKDISTILRNLEIQHGLKLSGGQGHLKGQIARISHMGVADREAAEKCIKALEIECS